MSSPSPCPPSPRAGGITRRRALKIAAAAAAGAGTGALGSALLTRLGDGAPPVHRFFTAAEAALVVELCAQIIPRDDVAGAAEAGVIHYIDRQLAGRFSRHRAAYRAGLAAIARTCERAHGTAFATLTGLQKIDLMKRVERGDVPAEDWGEVAPATFFRMLVDHTMQGFYGGPRHGGSRGHTGYRVLGVDYPQIIGRNRPPGSPQKGGAS